MVGIEGAHFYPTAAPDELSGAIDVSDFPANLDETKATLESACGEETRSDLKFSLLVDEAFSQASAIDAWAGPVPVSKRARRQENCSAARNHGSATISKQQFT